MATTLAEAVTPAKPPTTVTVDISTIEAAKENIVPLHSGRSASQLAALSSSTRSGLGVKLEGEHARFAAQIAAVETYEQTGAWEDGKDGLSSEEVESMAEDPLDISHQYVRFIVANYPAGASAANKLVPVLEATTRKFLGDSRYINDPRYFRLWAHYAKNMENPEDCYRFLFAKGVAEKLAALYEEYAKVLEAKYKRTQADRVYNLGINRRATPLDRLKRSYLDFQARMLVAPPAPSLPRATATSSASNPDSRSILSSSTSRSAAAPSTGGTGVGAKGNGGMFAVFRDDSGGSAGAEGKEAGWEEFGTVKGRQRENNEEKKEWQGEVMLQKGAASVPKAGGFKLEVYRDESATTAAALSHPHDPSDVFSRSTRPSSEAELLRANPFKNYSALDADLLTRDPLEGLEVLPRASSKVRLSSSGVKKERSSSSASGSSQSRTKPSSSSRSTSSSSKTSSSQLSQSQTQSSQAPAPVTPGEKPKERVAVSLRLIYPSPGVEYSFEELKAKSRKEKYLEEEVESWNGWEWREKWEEEVERTGRTEWVMEEGTGWPVLFGRDGEPLYDFLPRPAPPTPEPVPVAEAPSPAPASPTPVHNLLSPSPNCASRPPQNDFLVLSPTPRSAPLEPARSPSPTPEPEQCDRSHLDPNRPPSPTMNTRAANAMLDHLFAKTLDFTKVNGRGSASSDEDEDDEEEPSTDESDDEEEPSFGGVPGAESQYSTQGGATQQSQDVSTEDGGHFVPFSQTRSQMGDDSGFYGAGSQRPPPSRMGESQLGALGEEDEDEGDENAVVARPAAAPMQLFRDAPSGPPAGAVPSTPAGAFRPVTKTSSARAPFGMKSGTPLTVSSAVKQPLFSVLADAPKEDEEELVIPSSQPHEGEQRPFGGQVDFEAPLAGGGGVDDNSDEDDEFNLSRATSGDGYDLGRRMPGQSRYAPFVEQMTPIVERTLEFTSGSLGASTRGRRDSYYPTGAAVAAVQEEDEDEEPSTEEDDDDEDEERREQAFVAGFASQPPPPQQQQQQQIDLGEDSSFQTNGSSSESDSDDDDEQPPIHHQQPLLPPSLSSPPPPQPAALGHFTDAGVGQSSPAASRSFEVSLNDSTLPEGLTITGNQTGMSTNVLVNDSTSSSLAVVKPYKPDTIAALLDRADSSVFDHPDVHDLRSLIAGKLPALQKTAKKREKSKTGGKDRTGVIDDAWDLELNGEVFSVREKLGEGTFGAVFRVALTGGDDEDDFDADAEDELSLAVKVETPTNVWEFHILERLHSRLSDRTRASVVSAQRLYAYQDESFLFLDYCDRGRLLDAVNSATEAGVASPSPGQGLDELLAMFFVVELLRVLDGFHSAGFIHGDLKIDNCLLRLEDVPGGVRAWSSAYDATGANGWGNKGVKLIDFGRSIDTTLFPPGQTFTADFEYDATDCAEMREGRPWSFEGDYHGVAGIAYNVLFGKNIDTVKVSPAGDDNDGDAGETKWTLNHSWKRYYQVELWTKLFDLLLNPKSARADQLLPIGNELGEVRREMEKFLRDNGEKNGKSLRGMIKKLEIYSMSR